MISVGASHVILFDKQKKDICYQLELGKKLSRFSEHLISGFHGDMYMESNVQLEVSEVLSVKSVVTMVTVVV